MSESVVFEVNFEPKSPTRGKTAVQKRLEAWSPSRVSKDPSVLAEELSASLRKAELARQVRMRE